MGIISIPNTGSSLRKEELSAIFVHFHKVDRAHTEEVAGLGLSIAKEVVTIMNGNIYARNDWKNETSFCFELQSDVPCYTLSS